MRSRLWWCEWHKRTGIGAIDESMVRYPILDTSLPAARSQRFWNGLPRAGAEPEDGLEGVSEQAVGDDCGHGFLHCRGVDPARFAAVHGAVLHRLVYTQGRNCRDRTGGERVVDEPDCPESHGFGGRNPDRK